MTDPAATLSTIERREPHWEEAASSADASSGGMRVFAIRIINYVTNHIVCHIPSFGFRRFWYSRVLGVHFGERAGVHLGCYLWFYGPGQVRRDGVSIGENSRINRDCSIDVRGGDLFSVVLDGVGAGSADGVQAAEATSARRTTP